MLFLPKICLVILSAMKPVYWLVHLDYCPPHLSVKVQRFLNPFMDLIPQAAGKDIANPLGSILSAAMLLDHFGLKEESARVREAVNWTLQNGFVTKDIDPVNFYFTSTIGDLIADYVANRIPAAVNQANIELRKSTII